MEEYLPELYFIDKNGKERVWAVWVKNNTKFTKSGFVDGKITIKEHSYESKNVGKKNQTTPHQQAVKEAYKQWIKMINANKKPKDEKGIEMMQQVQSKTRDMGGFIGGLSSKINNKKGTNFKLKSPFVVTDLDFDLIKPMKTKIWTVNTDVDFLEREPVNRIKKYFDLEKGVWVQPKLDGVRCVSFIHTNKSKEKAIKPAYKVIMSSNNRKQFPWFEHIRKEILALNELIDLGDGLDGELYIHHTNFSLLQGMASIARSKPHADEVKMQYHIFDLVDRSSKLNQKERFDRLNQIFNVYNSMEHNNVLIKVPHYKIENFAEVNQYHNDFVSDKYEGVIIRDWKCHYVETRSSSIQKYKSFKDAEYKIIDSYLDSGVDMENFVWVCEINDDNKSQFKVKQTGTKEFRRELYQNRKKYIGAWLNVRYQELSKDQIPRFPIGLHIREEWDI